MTDLQVDRIVVYHRHTEGGGEKGGGGVHLQVQKKRISYSCSLAAPALGRAGVATSFAGGQCNLKHTAPAEHGMKACKFAMDLYPQSYKIMDREAKNNPLGSLRQGLSSWTDLFEEFLVHGHVQEAFQLFDRMKQEGININPVTLISLLKSCTRTKDVVHGMHVHAQVVESGYEPEAFVECTLVDMYGKCGCLDDAFLVFERLPAKSLAVWNALISGYVQHGSSNRALEIFEQVKLVGFQPNRVTFVLILKACSSFAALEDGQCIHNYINLLGSFRDDTINNALISMYMKCGSFLDACALFNTSSRQNVCTWNILMTGYTEQGCHDKTIKLFDRMQQEGVEPNRITFLAILRACAGLSSLEKCRHIHAETVRAGYILDTFVGNSLVSIYMNCDSLEDAQNMFNLLPKHDVVSWNILIGGYVQHGFAHETFCHSKRMQEEGVKPNRVTFVNLLKACSYTAALDQGRHLHMCAFESGCESDLSVSSSLIKMYAICGKLDEACIMFERVPIHSVVTWNALIGGLSQHCEYFLAFQYFKGMQQAGVKPDRISFLCLLSACSHLNLTDEGCRHFLAMRDSYGLRPLLEHHNSMVNLFGQAREFDKAEDLLETIPFCGNITGWTSLLSSCRKHTCVTLGRRSFDHLVAMDHEKAAGYVLMSNVYAYAGLYEDAQIVEGLRRCTNGWKKPGKAFIEIDNQVHCFNVGESKHLHIQDVRAKVKALSSQLKEEPCLDLVVDSVSDHNKEAALCGQCKKLVLAFGLVCSAKGTARLYE